MALSAKAGIGPRLDSKILEDFPTSTIPRLGQSSPGPHWSQPGCKSTPPKFFQVSSVSHHGQAQSCFHRLWSNPQLCDEQGESRSPSSLLFKPLAQSSRRLLSDFTHSLSHSGSPRGKSDLWSSTGAEAEEPLPILLPTQPFSSGTFPSVTPEIGAGVRRAGRACRKSLQIRLKFKTRLERGVIPNRRGGGRGEDSRLESAP